MKKLRRMLFLGCFLFQVGLVWSQDSSKILSLSLRNVVDLAIEKSSSVKYVQNRNVNYYWRWRNFRASFRPRLTLTGDLPNYSHTTNPVVQPDGSIEFKQISQLGASANVALSQLIPQTGTSIYAASSMYGIRDYFNNTVNFSGSPFYIGFVQPIFSYNSSKWARQTEPLVYEEAQKEFIESIEEISYRATNHFFSYLRIQTNYNLAENNLKNSQDNLKIAEVKRELGQISENDFARIQLSVFNAQKALNKAQMDLKNADFELKSYIGLDQNTRISLLIPLDMTLFTVDAGKALSEAITNRKETPEFYRRLVEADRELIRAKRSNGLSATLRGSFGLSNSAENMIGIYQNPERQRELRLSLAIPILDWGRSMSRVKLAESRRDLVLYDVEQDRSDFERGVVVQVEQFNLLKDQLETARQADKVAENGYMISLKKFQNGEISITDLNISLQERESAKRDYIASIEDYWESFYMIRILTLYDFEFDEKIYYVNPMLDQNVESVQTAIPEERGSAFD
jgi:outer membrane protein TolC